MTTSTVIVHVLDEKRNVSVYAADKESERDHAAVDILTNLWDKGEIVEPAQFVIPIELEPYLFVHDTGELSDEDRALADRASRYRMNFMRHRRKFRNFQQVKKVIAGQPAEHVVMDRGAGVTDADWNKFAPEYAEDLYGGAIVKDDSIVEIVSPFYVLKHIPQFNDSITLQSIIH